jgi:ADP-ribosyl-[dinitrogen reductase] hydrolase
MIANPSWLHDAPVASLEERALGAYLGFALGDALGATVEFMTAREIAATWRVHQHIVGGGWLRLKPGQITDDTQMCLALGRAILEQRPWHLPAVADSFVRWMRSKPVDIGHTCRRGLRRYLLDGTLSAAPAEDSGGNGAAMRNLPVVLSTLDSDAHFESRTLQQAHLTHHHPLSDAATLALGRMTRHLLLGGSRDGCASIARELVAAHREFQFEPWPGNTTGYIVDTTQTVLEAFFATTSYAECVIRAVNRGGDADTIGALAGQLAGAHYGVSALPAAWLKRLDRTIHAEIRDQASRLVRLES